MNLQQKLQKFKDDNPDRLEHTFKDGTKFKGSGNYKLHYWIDRQYREAVEEWKNDKQKNIANFLINLVG